MWAGLYSAADFQSACRPCTRPPRPRRTATTRLRLAAMRQFVTCGGLSTRRVLLVSASACRTYARTRARYEPVIPPSCFVLVAKLSAVDTKTRPFLSPAPAPAPAPALAPGPSSQPPAPFSRPPRRRPARTQPHPEGPRRLPEGPSRRTEGRAATTPFSRPLDLRAVSPCGSTPKTILFGSRDPRVYESAPAVAAS